MSPPDAAALPRVVLDTNVVLDWLVFDDPRTRPLAGDIEAGRWQWLRTPAMAEELLRVLAYPAIMARCADPQAVLQRAGQLCHTTDASPPCAPLNLRCSDPDDQGFIDLALAHRSLLVSRDKAVLALRRPALAQGVHVLTPAQWPGVTLTPA